MSKYSISMEQTYKIKSKNITLRISTFCTQIQNWPAQIYFTVLLGNWSVHLSRSEINCLENK
jgi:hypothetical protein